MIARGLQREGIGNRDRGTEIGDNRDKGPKNKENIQNYRLVNRERLNALQREKAKCECGCLVNRCSQILT